MVYDIAVIGGGASGLMSAICAKQHNPKLNIIILERLDRVGKKLLTTGNGRCNITNRNISPERYHGENPKFANHTLSAFTVDKCIDFFSSLGILITFDQTGRAYPYSFQASSVLDALRFRAEELGCAIKCNTVVEKISHSDNLFTLFGNEKTQAKSVIFATGGKSGSKIYYEGLGYNILKNLGHTITPLTPAIVQLKTETEIVKQLEGIKINATVTVDNGTCYSDFGEVLFCNYGISGPPVLQLSRYAREGSKIFLDIMPEYSEKNLKEIILSRVSNLSHRPLGEFFTGMLNKRLGQIIVKLSGLSLSMTAKDITEKAAEKMINLIKNFPIISKGNNGFLPAQVTHGGVSTKEIDDKTLMSKKITGLFFSGEVIDIDGDCGGFNLHWAWSSGSVAGKSAACYVEGSL